MSAITVKKDKSGNVTIVKKVRDYSKDPAFNKKAKEASRFLKKNGLPQSFVKKGK